MFYYSEKGGTRCSCGTPGPTWRLDTRSQMHVAFVTQCVILDIPGDSSYVFELVSSYLGTVLIRKFD